MAEQNGPKDIYVDLGGERCMVMPPDITIAWLHGETGQRSIGIGIADPSSPHYPKVLRALADAYCEPESSSSKETTSAGISDQVCGECGG
jgi:hypothetical protein